MAYFRSQSYFIRSVIVPFLYYIGLATLVFLLVFSYYMLRNAILPPPIVLNAVELGDTEHVRAPILPNTVDDEEVTTKTKKQKPLVSAIRDNNKKPPSIRQHEEIHQPINIPRNLPPANMMPPGGPVHPAPGADGIPPVIIPGQNDFGPHVIGGQVFFNNAPEEIRDRIRQGNIAVPPFPGKAVVQNRDVPPHLPLAERSEEPPVVKQNKQVKKITAPAGVKKGSTPETVTGKPRKSSLNRGEPGTDSYYKLPEQLNTIVKVNKTAYKSRTCKAITGRRILMNYAHNCCQMSQPLNCQTGLKNGFDICIQFTQQSIEPFFIERNKEVFAGVVMAGYGAWKSYLIMRLLMTLDDDDVLFYSDSGARFIDSPEDYFCLMDQRSQDTVVFSVGLPEDEYTKGDAFTISGCTREECVNTQQRLGGYSMYRKSMASFHFLSVWMTLNTDTRVVSDNPSELGKDMPKFKTNRHDQTALSLSSKRVGLPEWPDPSQWGEAGWNKMLREKPEFKSIAKTIIDCTRDKS